MGNPAGLGMRRRGRRGGACRRGGMPGIMGGERGDGGGAGAGGGGSGAGG